MSETLKLWKSVEKTDPAYTKSFSRAGGFSGTAINATYLIRKATEIWGPFGGKWGATVADEKYVPGAEGTIVHVVRIDFWHPDGKFNTFGQTTFVGKNKNGAFTDEEAPKKSLTDAITKALSMLGFSADVHLGMYDDNKYVNDLRAEFGQAANQGKPPSGSATALTHDAWDALDAEEQKFLQSIVDTVRAALESQGADAAKSVLEANKLDNEEKLAIWSRFSAKERSALKAAGKKAA